ncbi:hypothetical protein ACU4GD_45085 [Cupriavidus basilensis]
MVSEYACPRRSTVHADGDDARSATAGFTLGAARWSAFPLAHGNSLIATAWQGVDPLVVGGVVPIASLLRALLLCSRVPPESREVLITGQGRAWWSWRTAAHCRQL